MLDAREVEAPPPESDRIGFDLPPSDTDTFSSATLGTAACSWDIGDPEDNCVRCGRYWKWRCAPLQWAQVCQHCRDSTTHMARLQWRHLTIAYLMQIYTLALRDVSS